MKYSCRYFLMSVFLFFTFVSFGQKKKIIQGFYITMQNDTIKCDFKSRNWKKQPFSISVSVNNTNSVLIPADVSEVNIVSLETKYVSRKIAPANYNDNLLFVEDGAIPSSDSMRPAFLKSLYTGRLNLYLYIDKLKRNHFFVEDKDNFLEIYFHNHKESLYTNSALPIYIDNARKDSNPGEFGVSVSSKNKQFEFVLKTLMTPCRSLFGIIENIGVNEEQLVQVLKLYDRCMEEKRVKESN
jgi:hypothetical protein